MAADKIYIPTFIADGDFQPSNVLPRFFFFNGMKDCNPFEMLRVDSDTLLNSAYVTQSQFPYFDHYNTGSVETGSLQAIQSSDSLLFFNETPAYGQQPTSTLFSEYWQTYIELLYDPRTRLINCAANIPLADYFKMELNDVVEFRGNYYHLRAINDYNLVTGECRLQLLGPIIQDTLDEYFAGKV